jgi:hypothetical protein
MSPDLRWPHDVLGLTAPPETQADIRRAYAKRLKTIDQSTDITGFTALRHAYEAALAMVESHEQPPAPQATPDTAPPPEPPPLTNPAPAPTQPDPDLRRLTTLLTTYGDGRPLADRITEILAHPLSQNPDHAPTLRRAIAKALINTSQPGSDDRNLPVSITQALLLYLDRYYGWLSDYTAFAADFPGDTELLDLMATRAFPDMGKSRRAVEAPRPTGAFARIWGLIGDWRIMVFLLFIFAQLGRAIGFKGDSGGQFETAADQELLTGLIMLAMVTVSLVFLFRYLRKTRSQLQSLLICTWCGA